MLDSICELTGATSADLGERIQALWSGYGEIVRVHLHGAAMPTVIAKRIAPPQPGTDRHPRGWNTERSHLRKLRSYEVEAHWYENQALRTGTAARIAACYGHTESQGERVLVLEDLDASGFGGRRSHLTPPELDQCLAWLAEFHAEFIGCSPDGLWPTGTYWHLDTRPDELAALQHERLRHAAPQLDAVLRQARFRTFVHGDAKVANFCFGAAAVAAVDFEYVGGGCGIQDVAYFLGSCLDDHELTADADAAIDTYFAHLRTALATRRPDLDADSLESEWRDLYVIAWADFVRWLEGWASDGRRHRKLHGYAARVTNAALERLGQ